MGSNFFSFYFFSGSRHYPGCRSYPLTSEGVCAVAVERVGLHRAS